MIIQNITNSYSQRNYLSFYGVKPNKLSQPRIKNCEVGTLPVETQNIIQNIQQNWLKIKAYFDAIKTKQIKSVQIRKSYEPLIRRSNKQGLTFQTPDENELVSVIQSRSKDKNLLRFIIEKDTKTRHILVDSPDKVVKNLDETNPFYLPPKFRYMTNSEIENSNISYYAEFMDKEVGKYFEYLQKYDELHPKQKSGPKVGYKRPVRAIPKTYELNDVMKIFDSKAGELPNHLNAVVSPRTGNILGINLITSAGTKLRISKKMNAEYGNKLLYLSFEETFPDGRKAFINVDLTTREFLKTNHAGKPVIEEDVLYSYTPEEVESAGLRTKLNHYLSEVFENKCEVKSEPSITLFKEKSSQKRKNIEQIDISNLEDKNLNKLLDKENFNLD